jgi:hypothetical protein
MSAEPSNLSETEGAGLNMTELLPDFFERYFAFFRPGHTEGVVPSRIKELARIKIAALNGCDT